MTSENNSRDLSESAEPRPTDANTPSEQADGSGFRAIDPKAKARRRRPSMPTKSSSSAPRASASTDSASVVNPATQSPNQPAKTPTSPKQSTAQPARSQSIWRNAPRAERWQKLKAPAFGRFKQSQLITFLAVPLLPLGLHVLWHITDYYWVRFATSVLRWRMQIPQYHFPVPGIFHPIVSWASFHHSLPPFLLSGAQVLDMLILSVITFFGAPYFLRYVLQWIYQVQPWSIARLGQVSAEAQRRVQTDCQQRNVPLPKFGLLPTSAPIIFTYGTVPKNSCIVLSQGLLDCVSEDELGALCSAEVSQIHPLNSGLMSWIVALLQVPYLIYGVTAQLADYVANWAAPQDNRFLELAPLVAVYGLALISSIAYIVFIALRWMGLWFTRQRSIVADHGAASLTGNPNGHARALLKLAAGISRDIQRQGQTDFLLEGFELAMPVGYRQAITVGSLLPQMPIEQILAWDWGNPQRHYLTFNNSHALLGNRMIRLMQYARDWQLPPELDMQQCTTLQQARRQPPLGQLFTVGLPFWCAAIGYLVALLLWVIAWGGYVVGFKQVAWLGSDFRPMYALPLLGFGIGLFLRFNRYFPDLPQAWLRRLPEPTTDLAALVQDPQALPNQVQPTALTGKLIGRRGVANWLAQDLLLESERGLVRLHYPSYLGWLTNLWWFENRAVDLLGQPVSLLGWLRRGATPWMDVEYVRNQYGKVRRGGHQVWNTVLAISVLVMAMIWLGVLEDLISVIQRAQNVR